MVSVAAAISETTGVDITTIPASLTSDRAKLLKTGVTDISYVASFDVASALQGAYEFEAMGPQSWRVLWVAGPSALGFPVRGDSGIKTIADLKGKKVADYVAYTIMVMSMRGALAFGDLTWDDVIPIPVSGYPSGMDAVIDGTITTAAFGSRTAKAQELEASIHGIHWLELPASNTEAWARFQEFRPDALPFKETIGAGITADNPKELYASCSHTVAYDSADENLVYWFTKHLHEDYNLYKDTHAALLLCTIEQTLNYKMWFAPLHNGAIRYFKDIGMWTGEHERKQQELLVKYPQTMTK